MRRLPLLVPLLALALIAAGACGSDDRRPSTQPAPDVTVFAQGEFGMIPVMPLSEPVGTRSEEAESVAQSFQVRNTSPDEVFAFYRDRLEPEWTLVEEPHPLGQSENPSYRAIWNRDQHRLIVSVASAGALEGSATGQSEHPTLQYSLSLEAAGVDTFESNSPGDG